MSITLGAIIEQLGGNLHGPVDLEIQGIAPLEFAHPHQISFLSHPKYQSQLLHSKAGCVIVATSMVEVATLRGPCIVVEHPYLYFAKLTQLWKKNLSGFKSPHVHPSAVIDPSAFIHPLARIGALCVIESGVRIGAGTELKSSRH